MKGGKVTKVEILRKDGCTNADSILWNRTEKPKYIRCNKRARGQCEAQEWNATKT